MKSIVRAGNCDLIDSEDTPHVELESGVWCTSLGPTRPRVIKALGDQAAQIDPFGFNDSSLTVEVAAAEVLSVVGMLGGRCTFLLGQ